MTIKNLDDFVAIAKKQDIKRIAVAAAADIHVLEALKEASGMGLVKPILIGDKAEIIKISSSIQFDISNIKIVDENDPVIASQKAVALIRENKAEILMKGLVATGSLLKAVLDKEKGLRKGGLLSHVAFFESPFYHKVFCVTDAAMNVAPELNEKISIVKNAVEAYHKLGVPKPKVAIIAAVETVNPKMEATVHGALLTQMNKRNQI